MSFENLEQLCLGCFSQLHTSGIICHVCGYDPGLPPDALYRLQPRTILNGKYMIGKVLGEGGFGITYIGYDLNLEVKVAVKEYYPTGLVMRSTTVSLSVQPVGGEHGEQFTKGRERFVDEAKRLARFRMLPGIVMVNDFFVENGTAYIVMEYIEGQTLKGYLVDMGGKLPAAQVFEMMKPVFASLSQVHESGIIHRDISPDNIMITRDGSLKLLDFGAAREFAEDGNKSLSVMLKHGYAPAEQYTSKGQQGPHTDVYALSATIYKAITGVTPENSLDRMMEDTLAMPGMLGIVLPGHQEAAIMKGLAVRHENRFRTIAELFAALLPPTAGSSVDSRQLSVDDESAEVAPIAAPQRWEQPPPSAGGTPLVREGGMGGVPQGPNMGQQIGTSRTPSPTNNKKKIIAAVIAACLVIAIVLALALQGESGGDDAIMRIDGVSDNNVSAQNGSSFSDDMIAPSDSPANADGSTAPEAPLNYNVVQTGFFERSVSNWHDIIEISAGGGPPPDMGGFSADVAFTVGLKPDGTVIAVGNNRYGQCDVSDWRDIVEISAGANHTVGLKSDGTVAAAGSNDDGQCDVSDWRGIVAVSAGRSRTIGLKSDGTVIVAGHKEFDSQFLEEFSGWHDIVAVSAGTYNALGLKSDGTVVGIGYINYSGHQVSDWQDIVAVSAGERHAVGLKSDGTVLYVGDSTYFGISEVADWSDIVAVSAGYGHIVGLRSDGTVVAVGRNTDGQYDVSSWRNITAISAGYYHTAAITSTGAGAAESQKTAEQTQGRSEAAAATDRGLSAIFPVRPEDNNADIRTLESISFCDIYFHSNWEGDTWLTADEIRDVTVYVDGVPNTVAFSNLREFPAGNHYDESVMRLWRITLDTDFTQAPAMYQFSLNVKGMELTVNDINSVTVNADRTFLSVRP